MSGRYASYWNALFFKEEVWRTLVLYVESLKPLLFRPFVMGIKDSVGWFLACVLHWLLGDSADTPV